MPSTAALFLGFLFNLIVTLIIVRGIYFPQYKKKSQAFTFIVINSLIFVLMTLLMSAELSIGTAFGLFAVFSILRYRTEPIAVRDMTYMFILMGLAMINATPLVIGSSFLTIVVANALIIVVLFIAQKGWGFTTTKATPPKPTSRLESQKLLYPYSDLLHPDKRELLLGTLRADTGLPIEQVKLGRIDLVNQEVELTVYYAKAINA